MGVSPAVELLANKFRSAKAGRSAAAARDLLVPFNDLLRATRCLHGTARHEAVLELESLASKGVVVLERHPRDKSAILKVRVPLATSTAFFAALGEASPEAEREALAQVFLQAASTPVPAVYETNWHAFCHAFAEAARAGDSIKPFERANPAQTKLILEILPRLLAWPGESLMRFASSMLTGHSKALEALRPKLERCLAHITDHALCSLCDVGILENERSFLIHGPLRLEYSDGILDLGLLKSPCRIAIGDFRRARISGAPDRCLTVENAAMLHELAKLQSGTLLVSSGSEGGFANSAVIEFLTQLPQETPLFHFGDSDPAGFDILRDLRERVRRPISSLHMTYRPSRVAVPLDPRDVKTIATLLASPTLTKEEKVSIAAMSSNNSKGLFEQESLGRPQAEWPFY